MRAIQALFGIAALMCIGAFTAMAQSGAIKPPAGAAVAEAKPAAKKGSEATDSEAKDTTAKDTAAKPVPAVKPAPKPVAARILFGAVKIPAPITPVAIGGYAAGCLAGASALPTDGKAWQAMRLSRNRHWGHPALVQWLEKFALAAQKDDGWPGLLVGDLSQPRGGPMLTGHASHQIGLDADIWLTPMPDRKLTYEEREQMAAVSMLAPDKVSVDSEIWDQRRARIIKRAASSADVERIFVHPAIKKALCEGAAALGPDKSWLSKVRAYWGHYYHFHVRLGCPKDSANCKPQPHVGSDDGCGAELAGWLKRITAVPLPSPVPVPSPKPPMTLDKLPAECKVVLETGTSKGIVKASNVKASGGHPTAATTGQQ